MENFKYRLIQEKLGLYSDQTITKNLDWFKKEAENRDQIVYNYFGLEGFNTLVKMIVQKVLEIKKEGNISILDAGLGAGTFSIPILNTLKKKRYPISQYFGLDISLEMLNVLSSKTDKIIPLIGRIEDIQTSINLNKAIYKDIPRKFDLIFVTLVLHHIPDLEKTFKSIRNSLKDNGVALILDSLPHPPDPFEPEAHSGFELDRLSELTENFFSEVNLIPLSDIVCSSQTYSANLFLGEFYK